MAKLSSLLKCIIFVFISVIIFLSLIAYIPQDISFLAAPGPKIIHNYIGVAGAYLAFGLFFIFGYGAYFLPFYFFFLGLSALSVLRFFGLGRNKIIKLTAFVLFTVFLSAFIGLFFEGKSEVFKASGISGFVLAEFFKKYLGMQGSFITLFLLIVINAILLFGFFFIDSVRCWGAFMERFAKYVQVFQEKRAEAKHKRQEAKPERKEKIIREKEPIAGKPKIFTKEEPDKAEEKCKPQVRIKPEIKVYTPRIDKSNVDFEPNKAGIEKPATKPEVGRSGQDFEKLADKKFDPRTYKLPTPQILKVPHHPDCNKEKENIEANIANLETALTDFGVEAKVVSVQKGPVVTMYELQPQAGVKIQKISTLADDIALAMKSSMVRVVAPLPGRGTVGVEIPNENKMMVSLREVLEEKAFTSSPAKLTMTIGKDVSGNAVVANLMDMPHLLIAGATGSGKTVCVNSLISSILFKAKPDEVKFILIDPKMVELAAYSGIPHLIHPIISESKKAFVALNWAVEEMERRYRVLAGAGVRNIEAYNNKEKDSKLPFIVIVVDELADLMVVARESVETAIQRLAQLSRAVGLHLILATQRPSVDVITGVIKANFPARIAFKVASKVDSRTVLDVMGADKLLGKGDLLFLKPGATKLIRTQGAYIDDEDIDNLTSFIREQGAPVYEQGIIESEKKRAMNIENDELFDEAVKVVLHARQASASLLQRRLRVGYTRAARLLDLMEQAGVVGPFCGSKAREILVNSEEYLAEKDIV